MSSIILLFLYLSFVVFVAFLVWFTRVDDSSCVVFAALWGTPPWHVLQEVYRLWDIDHVAIIPLTPVVPGHHVHP